MIKLIDLLKEAKFGDIAVIPAKGAQRGASEAGARSFDINIGNPEVIKKMMQTPMGEPGSMQSFKYEGPEGSDFKDYEWDEKTTQWEVWKNMNYLILTPDHHTHWYHGKMPGGSYKGFAGSTGKVLPDLTIEGFGLKVYKALLGEPSVGFIKSDKTSSPEIKGAVYNKLMQDPDFVWIATNGNTTSTYDDIIVINPNHADVQKIRQQFEAEHKGNKFFYSKNFPK
jgi:hypothetical protein